MRKRSLSILLCIAMVMCFMPTVAFATEAITTWTQLQEAINGASDVSTIYLTNNLTAGAEESALVIPSGKTITLYLNGHTLDRGLKDSAAVSEGYVIKVEGNLTIQDSAGGSGTITGGNCTSNGGGVYVNGGTLIMDGGNITGNTANIGGGVSVGTSSSSTFTMNGGNITGNTAGNKGGGVYFCGATFTMSGGSIIGNTAVGDGGGVCTGKTFNMTGGEIIGNMARQSGGGVYTNGSSAVFTMTAGKIIGNTALHGGGACFDSDSKNYLSGTAEITKNVASGDGSAGGGVYVGNARSITFILGGSVKITDNLQETSWNEDTCEYITKASNLYMNVNPPYGTVQLGTGSNNVNVPVSGMKVGVTIGDTSTGMEFTNFNTPADTDIINYFFSDNDSYYVTNGVINEKNVLQLAAVGDNKVLNVTKGTVHETLSGAAVSGGTLKLLGDVNEGDSGAFIQNSTTITLDLNGHVIQGTGETNPNSVINITSGAKLTIIDSNPTIPHKFTVDGNGLWTLHEDATDNYKTVYGGCITGGNKAGIGGGVYIYNGTLTMNGGNIIGNIASESFLANGGGGGVCVDSGTFIMNGGSIMGNVASDANGGGVFCKVGSDVTLGGTAKITGNFKVDGESKTANNLYLPNGMTVGITAPQNGMAIGVTTQSEPAGCDLVAVTTDSGTNVYAKYFTSDNKDVIVKPDGGVVKLYSIIGNNYIASNLNKPSDYSNEYNVQHVIDNADPGHSIRLLTDITENINISKNITLDLNGHVLKGTGEGSVITVNSGNTLTIIDTNPTATHSGVYVGLPAGGCITGGVASEAGGGCASVNGTLNMYGGTIYGCTATSDDYDSANSRLGRGGAIYVYYDGEFNMFGGAIENCSAPIAGGAIFNIGDVKISGGKITGCSVSGMDDSGTVKAKGGAVYCFATSNFVMTSGEISGNTLGSGAENQCGAGVYVAADANATFGGTAKITGNTASGKANNLYLKGNTTITIDETNAPTDGFLVGISNPVPTEDANAVFTSNGIAADKYGFLSDSKEYKVVFEPVHLELATISSTGPVIPPAPPTGGGGGNSGIEIPVTGDNNSVKVSASLSGNTATVEKIKDADLSKVTAGESVTVDLSGLNKNIDTAKLPTETVEKIAEKTSMTVKLPVATVEFDKTATGEIADQAKGSTVELVVDDVKEVSLNALQKEAVGKLDTALIIDAYLVSNGSRLCSADNGGFGGGKAKVILPYEIKNNRKPANYSVFYVNDAGELQKLNATYDKNLAAFVFEIAHFSVYAVAYDENADAVANCPKDASCPLAGFGDLKAAAWYHDGVHFCLDNNLMVGYPDGTFKPSAVLTRAQVVTMLYRMAGTPTVTSKSNFHDVTSNDWFMEAVVWADENDIVNGMGGDMFEPNLNITREQLANILYRYAKATGVDTDAVTADTNTLSAGDIFTVSAWAGEGVHYCIAAGILSGDKLGNINPKATATRAEAAAMFQRF